MEMDDSPLSNMVPISHSLFFSVVLVYCDDVMKEQSGVLSFSLSVSSLVAEKWFGGDYLSNHHSQWRISLDTVFLYIM